MCRPGLFPWRIFWFFESSHKLVNLGYPDLGYGFLMIRVHKLFKACLKTFFMPHYEPLDDASSEGILSSIKHDASKFWKFLFIPNTNFELSNFRNSIYHIEIITGWRTCWNLSIGIHLAKKYTEILHDTVDVESYRFSIDLTCDISILF